MCFIPAKSDQAINISFVVGYMYLVNVKPDWAGSQLGKYSFTLGYMCFIPAKSEHAIHECMYFIPDKSEQYMNACNLCLPKVSKQ
jgi:hypothetical protein